MRALLWAAAVLCVGPAIPSWSAPASESPKQVQIHFSGMLGQKPFHCGEHYLLVGEHSVTVTPADLRFYVSEVALLDANGTATPVSLDQDGVWQYRNVALIDLEDGKGGCRNGNPATHDVVTGTVPSGNYTGIRFTLGIPFDLGHVDSTASPSPLNFTAMSWVWESGFKFVRAELLVENPVKPAIQAAQEAAPQQDAAATATSTGSPLMRSPGFPIHIGSTGCAAASRTSPPASECAHPNRATVTLTSFDPAHDTVVFDLDRLIAGNDLTQNAPDTAPGCMSGDKDPDCAPIFRALGLPFGNQSAVEQTVFREQAQ